MAIYTQPNLTSGLDDALVSIVNQPSLPFTPMLLVFVWGVVFLGGMSRQKARLGSSDIPMWATIASLSAFMVALPLTLTSGLIDLGTLTVVIAITIMSGVWLFLSRNRNEV